MMDTKTIESLHYRALREFVSLSELGHATQLNSLLPAGAGALAWRHSKNNFRSLPLILREQGYGAISMSVCPLELWNMVWMHYAYGFPSRYHYDSFRVGREDPMKIDPAAESLAGTVFEPIVRGGLPDEQEGRLLERDVLERIEISDLILEQNMIPSLLKHPD